MAVDDLAAPPVTGDTRGEPSRPYVPIWVGTRVLLSGKSAYQRLRESPGGASSKSLAWTTTKSLPTPTSQASVLAGALSRIRMVPNGSRLCLSGEKRISTLSGSSHPYVGVPIKPSFGEFEAHPLRRLRHGKTARGGSVRVHTFVSFSRRRADPDTFDEVALPLDNSRLVDSRADS